MLQDNPVILPSRIGQDIMKIIFSTIISLFRSFERSLFYKKRTLFFYKKKKGLSCLEQIEHLDARYKFLFPIVQL